MKTIAIPQLYCGASGQKGAYNRQEVGLARAFAKLGHRGVVLYPDPNATALTREEPEPGVILYTCPAKRRGASALYQSWQPLLDEKVDAVHCMGDNALGVPGLYRFCTAHGIPFYSQLGVLDSTSENPLVRRAMNLLNRRNLAIYRKTPTYAKTPVVAQALENRGIPCAGVLPVGLDTAIIPAVPGSMADARRALGLEEAAHYCVFCGRIDSYKRPLDLIPLLRALPDSWRLIVIGKGALDAELDSGMAAAGLAGRYQRIPQLPNTEVHPYYHACDVFVNLNEQEIFGMSLLEAMYAGCPPVARHAPGPNLIIEDGVSGYLADEIPALAAAIQQAAAAPALRQAAQQRIHEHFLWESSARTALHMLETL